MDIDKIGFSPGQEIEKLYEKVFEEIYPHIKHQKKGILSTVINLIVSQDAKEICSLLNIDNKASLEDDLSISSDIVGLFIINPNDKKGLFEKLKEDVKETGKNLRKYFGHKLEDHDMKLFQIVVIGCLIVGVPACIIFIIFRRRSNEQQQGQQERPPIKSVVSPPPVSNPQPVSLCLVVPASVLSENVNENSPINLSEIETLIDNSSYFLCKKPEEADKIQNILQLTAENINSVSEQREVFIRINIADGEQMLDKKIPYSLKRNLPTHGQGVVKKIACIEYLSVVGLENFNRII
ncbi:hypothetical protein B6N60_02831 [Richelia sinica FACHB-800]|uniref:Uncharacterized protein n=1 Tax=Richelia sinica FACHB-800 TaxID=1357546 RepID=A0A975T8I6_9NOST|nr:hypothetical protein [Richelia sinica]MBD2665354.1 hypothetical protein [Richelia sinica FACHB-800]QXE24127.1 hypothetical protein B6N60_02831 [Richelia sinica FACHB-800]